MPKCLPLSRLSNRVWVAVCVCVCGEEGGTVVWGSVSILEEHLGGCGLCPRAQGLAQLHPMAGTHLGPDAPEGLLQQQREAAHLPLEPVVVVGEGPQRWLQRQQVGPDAYGTGGVSGARGGGRQRGAGQGPGGGSPARFSCTAFISTWALAKASSMARFLSSSRDCISSSICPCARSSSASYMAIWRPRPEAQYMGLGGRSCQKEALSLLTPSPHT